ncbi:hypothetical protein IQ273_08560 [Nodosilinea sp. LEGE 07298]|uniref:hypothetical protein n=1 Tax=Nodosilinea sp. LEGE 07298 TaxID=2777970 RepID=UPI0018826450|nr:hypothetical protein [Nodosilinea sp. LEGE 07298]MBE9109466.1 hypothetical protein [Nodosilinea sp. LEGE 07298]
MTLINTPLLLGVFLVINSLILAVVVYATSSPRVSFWKGLRLLPNRYMSGCVNITILYIFFVLAYHYFWTAGAVALRLHLGRSHTQTWWVNHISRHTRLSRQDLEQIRFSAWLSSPMQLGSQAQAYGLLILVILAVTFFIFAR